VGKTKRWSDLSQRQQVWIVVGAVIQVSLLVATLVDLRRRPADQIRGPKALWTALAFVNYFGPITYFAVGRRRQAA